jgi:hypothetical protein
VNRRTGNVGMDGEHPELWSMYESDPAYCHESVVGTPRPHGTSRFWGKGVKRSVTRRTKIYSFSVAGMDSLLLRCSVRMDFRNLVFSFTGE